MGITPSLIRLELSKSNYMAQVDALPDAWSSEWLRKADQVSKSDKAAGALNWVVHPERITNNNPQVSVGHLEGHFYVIVELYQ